MAQLEQIDQTLPLNITPFQRDLDAPIMRHVDSLERIVLEGDDVAHFLVWAQHPSWRSQFEGDLQSVTNDTQGRKLLTTWLPLVTFREQFCCGGRLMQDPAMEALMDRLRVTTRDWRAAGVDTVDISGRALPSRPAAQ
jgi:hypothetical protein